MNMKNSKFTEAYLKIIAEETEVKTTVNSGEQAQTNEDACPECGDDPCTCEGGKVVTFTTTNQSLIDTINSGFQEVVFFVNAKDENGEDTVQEVKFGPEAFAGLQVTDDTVENGETTECGESEDGEDEEGDGDEATEEDEEATEEDEEGEEDGKGDGEEGEETTEDDEEDDDIAAEDWLEDGICVKCGDPKCDGSCKCPKCGSMNCIGECGETTTTEENEEGEEEDANDEDKEGEEQDGETATEDGEEGGDGGEGGSEA